MSKPKLFLWTVIGFLPLVAFSQARVPQPSPAEMAKKVEAACTACHGFSMISQQRLDRAAWTREVDKMTRWGAKVQPEDRDALINYFSRSFNAARPLPNQAKAVPAGKGAELFQTYCLACHNDTVVTSRKLTKAGWTAQVDQMIAWGAYVPAPRKDELIDYLVAHWSQ